MKKVVKGIISFIIDYFGLFFISIAWFAITIQSYANCNKGYEWLMMIVIFGLMPLGFCLYLDICRDSRKTKRLLKDYKNKYGES